MQILAAVVDMLLAKFNISNGYLKRLAEVYTYYTATWAHCVDGNTYVLNGERKRVRICELQPGDSVLSWTKRRFVVSRVHAVTRTWVPADYMCRIAFGDSSTIIATRNHPFWIDSKKWCSMKPADTKRMKAQQLKVGDLGVDITNRRVQVTKIEDVAAVAQSRSYEVFNLLVDGPGSWFANGILSHSGMRLKAIDKENVVGNAHLM